MSAPHLDGDCSGRSFVRAAALEWRPSSQAGVVRRELERGDGRAPRCATSIVRFAPGSGFPRHLHYVGEEIFVLAGVFSDESGHFGQGMYLRNPAGSAHGPYSREGCTIFIKLLPDHAPGEPLVIFDTARGAWVAQAEGLERMVLHADARETVTLERLAPGAQSTHRNGEELLLIEGAARSAEFGELQPLDWIQNATGADAGIFSETGAVFWAKRAEQSKT